MVEEGRAETGLPWVLGCVEVLSDALLVRTTSCFTITPHTESLMPTPSRLHWTFAGHTAQISGIVFSKTQPHMLWSSSFDGSVRLWDTRAQREVAKYRSSDPRRCA